MAIFDRAIVRLLPAVPRPVVQKLSERYIAGPELKDAREAVRRLNAEGKLATIDVLGEEITTEEEAAAIVRAYLDVFADIERCRLDSGVSVANCSRWVSCTDSACCSANSRSPRMSSSGSPPKGIPKPPSMSKLLSFAPAILPTAGRPPST